MFPNSMRPYAPKVIYEWILIGTGLKEVRYG